MPLATSPFLYLVFLGTARSLRLMPETMPSTPEGVCVYELPRKFNLGLLDSTFKQPEPLPQAIAWPEPQLSGLYEQNEFGLERLFYERLSKEATGRRPAYQCKRFYVPYFTVWETSAVHGIWIEAKRPKLDEELLSHLVHYNSQRMEKPDHFVVLGRVSKDAKSFLSNPKFEAMIKLTIEDTSPGEHENMVAIPYPTWFHVSRQAGLAHESATVSEVQLSCPAAQRDAELACAGRQLCAIDVWQQSCGSSVTASYSCAGEQAQVDIQLAPKERRRFVMSCRSGPCWTTGACAEPFWAAQDEERKSLWQDQTVPAVTIIGSARMLERDRLLAIKQCQKRPRDCYWHNTGSRGWSQGSKNRNLVTTASEIIMSSLFCLSPPGDTPTRKAIFDSLLFGCIPVVTDPASVALYRWHLPAWQDMVVLVNSRRLRRPGFNIVDYLMRMVRRHPHAVRARLRRIQELAHSLQYSLDNSGRTRYGRDALDTTLQQILLLHP